MHDLSSANFHPIITATNADSEHHGMWHIHVTLAHLASHPFVVMNRLQESCLRLVVFQTIHTPPAPSIPPHTKDMYCCLSILHHNAQLGVRCKSLIMQCITDEIINSKVCTNQRTTWIYVENYLPARSGAIQSNQTSTAFEARSVLRECRGRDTCCTYFVTVHDFILLNKITLSLSLCHNLRFPLPSASFLSSECNAHAHTRSEFVSH